MTKKKHEAEFQRRLKSKNTSDCINEQKIDRMKARDCFLCIINWADVYIQREVEKKENYYIAYLLTQQE